ncbi:hypothetical protein L6R52_41775 [Myxococcota bacterium]|nr:hypothetical protein [Myxococcota bacterium]
MRFSSRSLGGFVAATVAVAVALGVADDAHADQLVLVDGQVLEGIVTMKGGQVTIRLDVGTIGFDLKDVKEIRQGDSALAELDKRRRQIAAGDAAGLRLLATWADAKGLTTQATKTWQELLAVLPDDAQARERLGHQRVDGRWLTEEEVMAAKGLVRVGGVWRTAAEAAELDRELASRRAAREAAAEREKERRAWVEAEPVPEDRFPDGQVRVRGYPPYEAYDEATEGYDQRVLPYLHLFPYWASANAGATRVHAGKLPRPAARTPPQRPVVTPTQPTQAKSGATVVVSPRR